MYGIAGPLEQLRMRAETAEQDAKRAWLQVRMWKSAAFVWILVGLVAGFMAGSLRAIAADALPGQPHGVAVECWRDARDVEVEIADGVGCVVRPEFAP